MSEESPAPTPEPRKGGGFVDRLRQRISKRRKTVALGLAVYFLLALKWYPASMAGQRCFHGPLRLLFSGLTEEFRCPGAVSVCERSIWPLFLALPLGALLYLFFLHAAMPVLRFIWRSLRETFTCGKDPRQIGLRVLFLIVVLNMAPLLANRYLGETLSTETRTLHMIIAYGLLPLSWAVLGLYLASCQLLSLAPQLINLWLWPPGEEPSGFSWEPGFVCRGLPIEMLRFALLVLGLSILVGLLSRGCRRYPRVGTVVIVLLCVSLLVFAVIGIASPRTFR